MIARDSKSYPYLAIAQHYGIPYAVVLEYAEYVKNGTAAPTYGKRWRMEVMELKYAKQN